MTIINNTNTNTKEGRRWLYSLRHVVSWLCSHPVKTEDTRQ